MHFDLSFTRVSRPITHNLRSIYGYDAFFYRCLSLSCLTKTLVNCDSRYVSFGEKEVDTSLHQVLRHGSSTCVALDLVVVPNRSLWPWPLQCCFIATCIEKSIFRVNWSFLKYRYYRYLYLGFLMIFKWHFFCNRRHLGVDTHLMIVFLQVTHSFVDVLCVVFFFSSSHPNKYCRVLFASTDG